MSSIMSTYTFLPWLRAGLSNAVAQEDGDASVKLRATIPISLTVSPVNADGTAGNNTVVNQAVQLYGPGDIVGIDSRAIIRSEPHPWITNFEPNYFPYVDFYAEDFVWRHTPSKPGNQHLKPWITLIVLKEDEFEDGKDMKDKPLPFFRMKDGKTPSEIFPHHTELWAWAHVHINGDPSNGAALSAFNDDEITTAVTGLVNQQPDHAYSRIICPRKLEANVAYNAFVIPTFESGRQAGLGVEASADLTATRCGWEDDTHVEFPYYHRWYFRTGNAGDFEYLVNLLQPRAADKSVGVRDMDVLHPKSNLPGIDNAALQGVLKLGGALRVPFDTLKAEDQAEVRKYDQWNEPFPSDFTEAMARRINLGDDYGNPGKSVEQLNKASDIMLEDSTVNPQDQKGDPDPVITSPLYGRWHALQQRLLKDTNDQNLPNTRNWVHTLNLDPRFRAAAGLGTAVIQKGQEEYMLAAWEQVGKIIEANNKIRLAEVAKEVSGKLYFKHFVPLLPERAFALSAPVQKRIVYKGLSVRMHLDESLVPSAITSGAFRALTRSRGPFMKKLSFAGPVMANNLIERINNQEVNVVPPKVDPPGAIKLSDLAKSVTPSAGTTIDALLSRKWLAYLPLILLAIIILIVAFVFSGTTFLTVSTFCGVVLIALFFWLKKKQEQAVTRRTIQTTGVLEQSKQKPDAVETLPKSPDFKVSSPGSGFTPNRGNTDSQESKNFKAALRDVFEIVSMKIPEPKRTKLDFEKIAVHVIQSLHPSLTIPKRTFNSIQIPARMLDNMNTSFGKIMTYPEIDVPMYKPLADISSELFLPNINNIEQNSITLLENNQAFIEAYMVGINHEMSRELLWREFPTDQRGTYFRQFWDVSGFLPPQPVPNNVREALHDIPPIHTWAKAGNNPANAANPFKTNLGDHNQRALSGGKTQLVLTIRGELLKKYPTAVVYAHKADWGKINNAKNVGAERVFAELTESEAANPPTSKVKTPLFSAKVDPDIYFFGFDLDDEEARGTSHPAHLSDNPGWFFVLKEREGEPRFGLDITKTKTEGGDELLLNWNQLSWEHLTTTDGSCIRLTSPIIVNPTNSPGVAEYKPMEEDKQAHWGPNTTSAELAYILYQVPVLVGVHASRMLPK